MSVPRSLRYVAVYAVAAACAVVSSMRAAAQPTPITPIAENLEPITNLAVAADGRVFFSEKESGRIRVITPDGRLLDRAFATLAVDGGAERGLLGLALHPDFPEEPWVYAYLSDAADGRNRIVRLRADGNRADSIRPVFTGLDSGSGYHNGGDLAFGTDGMLYASLGDAHEAERAQDPEDPGGKIVRLAPDGSIPADNPLGPDNPVFALGIRNSFGLCTDPSTGTLWETENGPDRDDEVNRIDPGANYGWPDQLGTGGGANFTDPQIVFHEVVVPTGCAVVDGALYFGEYSSGRLQRARLSHDGQNVLDLTVEQVLPDGLVDVAPAPDGSLLVAMTGSIARVEIARAPETNDPSTSPSAPAVSPAPSNAPGGQAGSSAGTLIVWLAGGVLLALGSAALIAGARRRKRRRAARRP